MGKPVEASYGRPPGRIPLRQISSPPFCLSANGLGCHINEMSASSFDPSALPPPTLEAAATPRPVFAPPPPQEAPPPAIQPIESISVPETLTDWFEILLDALTYPPRKEGWFILLPGALLGIALAIGSLFGMHFAIFPLIFGTAYFAAYYLSVIESTISGRDQPPDWPAISSLSDDLMRPLLVFMVAAFVSFAPSLAYHLAVHQEDRSHLVVQLLNWLGKIYFPMALLSHVMQSTFTSLLPHQVLPAMARSWFGYLIVTGLLVAMGLLSDAALELTSSLSWTGPLFGFLILLWFLLVHGRLMGLFYLKYQQKLGW